MLAACGPSGLQPQAQYAWAIGEAGSLSPPIVRVALVDGRSGQVWQRCLSSDALIDAIAIEQRLPRTTDGYRQAGDLALVARDHRFTFARPETWAALDRIGPAAQGELRRACALIGQGRAVRWSGIAGRVVESGAATH